MDTSLDWHLLRGFLAAAEAGSLSGGARALNLTQPTLSRQIALLEDKLSLTLFERVGRGLELTESGRAILAYAREMGEAARKVDLAAAGQRSDLTGWVRITASDIMSVFVLPGVIETLRQAAPNIQIDVVATNDISDLMRREADVAIRHVRPTEPDLVARMVQSGRAYFYGATSLLDQHERPRTVADLGRFDWVSFGNIQEMISYLDPMGIKVAPERFRVGSNSGLVAWRMAREGFGLCAMYSQAGDIAPEMERVLPDDAEIDVPIWIVAHREVQTSPKIRLVVDILAKALKPSGSAS